MSEATNDRPETLTAALADLYAKRAKLDAQIELLEELTGASPTTTPAPSGDLIAARPIDGQTIRPDEFFGMNILDATVRYLGIMKKPQSLGSISAALERGGLMHQSKNFGATVFTTLRRAEDRGDRVMRFQTQWALAAWYPNRPRPAKEEKPKRAKAKKSSTKKAVAKPKLALADGAATIPPEGGSQQIAS